MDMKTADVYTGPIFDADTHVLETTDCVAFNHYMPEKYRRDWGFSMRSTPEGNLCLYVGERKVEISEGYYTADGRVPPPGKLHEWLRAMKEGKENVDMRVPPSADMFDRDQRLKKLDEFNVDGCVMFIGNMVAALSYLDEVEPANAVFHAYNQWLDEKWGLSHQDRIFSTPILNLFDLDAAIEEAEWIIERGAKVAVMPMGPVNGKSPADPYFDPFWARLNEAGVRVTYHVSEADYMKTHMSIWGEPTQRSRQKQSAFVWMHGYGERPVIETLSSFIFYNFFERFPNMKLMSAENGCEWVPNMLVKMDKVRGMAKNGFWPCGQLKERPSNIFKRHVYVVAYPEDDIKSVVEQTGSADFLLMGSDYPHAEGVPEPKDFANEACRELTPEQTRGVMHDNGWRFING